MANAMSPNLDGTDRPTRVVRVRDDLRAGLPDTRSPNFVAETRRQLKLIADTPRAAEDQAFVDSISIGFDDLD